MVSGTQAACHPREVPTRIRVIGMRATMRMMKGMERPMLTIWESTQYRAGLRNCPRLPVETRASPSRSPRMTVMAPETKVIARVSTRA